MKNNTSDSFYGTAIVAGSPDFTTASSLPLPSLYSYHRHWLKELAAIQRSAILVAASGVGPQQGQNRSSGQRVSDVTT